MADEVRGRELRGDFGAALSGARASLESAQNVDGLLELWEHGLISSQELMTIVWQTLFANKPALTAVGERLAAHPHPAINQLPVQWAELLKE